jgi:hypothetical protein
VKQSEHSIFVSPGLLSIRPGIKTLDKHWNTIYINITTKTLLKKAT